MLKTEIRVFFSINTKKDLLCLLKLLIIGFILLVTLFFLSFSIVNALWRCPTIVPVVYTNSFVSQKIIEGASLMVPGIVVPVVLEFAIYS